MPSEAARLEAIGETEAVVRFRGRTLRVPLDLDEWPLPKIRAADWVGAVDELLAGQRLGIADPLLDDYRELSEAMAEAVGVGRLPEEPSPPDQWFGGVPRLLRLLDHHEPDVELDLRRIGVDYRDRFRGTLTLRQVWVYVRRSLATSAVAVADNGGKHVWTEGDFITASIYQALTGEVYPGRPLKPAEVAKAIEAMQAKAAHAAKLRERQAHYAPTPPPAAPGLPEAMQAAIANREAELGATPDG
ncbi:tail assembly chaperone [Mycobacterium phage Weirdo19]|uniref:Tail assembly chaperone n=1 Tax=Mycobacterium phage Weirdo19 TaxID=2601610 RepID=A0A6M2YSV3_9CAUD|nr:tail assembly chaperone [Mycobacterium phage Weirdo19]QEA10782.1 tail assembly chaperone [Mycobacterium phage Weirdo19]